MPRSYPLSGHVSCTGLLLPIALLAPWAGLAQTPASVPLPPATARLDAEFSDLTSIRELRDGRVLLYDRKESRFVVADLISGSVRDVARIGQGPAEFQHISQLVALDGDSTLAADLLRRWLILVGDSVVATLPPDTPAIRAISLWPRGGDRFGHVLSVMHTRGGDSALVGLVDRRSGRVDTVATLHKGQRRAPMRAARGPDGQVAYSMSRIPLDVTEVPALGLDGWLAIARLDPYRVDWRAADGRWIRGAPLPFRRIRMDRREQRAYAERNSWAEGATDWPEYLPPFDDLVPSPLVLAPDGMLLIKRLPSADEPERRYDVVDRQGTLRGQFLMEPNQHILGFGERTVYVVTTDDDGLQFLSRHPWPSEQLRG